MAFIDQIIVRFTIILFIFCFSTASAQSEVEADSLLATASELLYSQPKLSEKIAKLVYENNTDVDKKAEALYLLSQIEHLNANYRSSLSNLYTIESLNENMTDKASWNVKVNFFLAKIYRELQILDLAEIHFDMANKAFDAIGKPDRQLSEIYNYENGLYQSEKKEFEKSNRFFKNSLNESSDFKIANRYLNYLGLGHNFIFEKKLDSAQFYFLKIPKANDILFAQSSLGLAEVASSRSEWKSAEQILLREQQSDVQTQKQRFALLSREYLKSGNIEQHEFYKNKVDSLELKINQNKDLAENYVIQHIEEQEDKNNNNPDSFWTKSLLITIGVIILLLVPIIYYYFKTRSDYKKYLEVIKEISPEQKTDIDEDTKEKQAFIPEKAEQILLKKLAKFENSDNYLNQKISLTTLSKQLETNTKYLSEVINKNKEKNFNSYINDLRINYILIKLKTEQKYRNYKVTSLAEECGFASHNTFVAAFRSVTGLSPASFINFLKREKNL